MPGRRPGGLVLNGSEKVARIEASERGYSGLAGWSILANARGIALTRFPFVSQSIA